jgi:hypothetical protein
MKKFVETQVVDKEGFEALACKNVLVFCMNYIYTGRLVGVNDKYIKLEKAKIVYLTGAFTTKTFEDAQALPFDQYIQLSAIESYGETDKQ